MPTCPAGHESATADYCDECGVPMTPAAFAAPAPHGAALPGLRRGAGGRRPVLRGLRARLHQAAPAPAPWSVVATADRAWFAEVCRREGPDIAPVTFPQYCPPRTFRLVGGADGDRAPQPLPRRRARDRPVGPAARPGRLHVARRAAGGPGRRLGPRRRRLAQRHRGERPPGPDRAQRARCASRSGDRIMLGALDGADRATRSVSRGSGRARAGAPGPTGPATAGRSRRGCRPRGPAPARR